MDANHKPSRVRSLKKAIDILNLLAEWETLGLTEIAIKLALPKSTAQGLLYTLRDEGYLQQSTLDGRYRLGTRLFELGSAVARSWSMRERAVPFLESLRESLALDAFAYHLSEGRALCIASAEVAPGDRTHTFEGRRLPLHCTAAGKVILAHMPESDARMYAERKGLAIYTHATLGSWELLASELDRVRVYGYAIEVQEYRAEQRAVAAPVLGYDGAFEGAIAVVGSKENLQGETLNYAIKIVCSIALALSREMGQKRQQ